MEKIVKRILIGKDRLPFQTYNNSGGYVMCTCGQTLENYGQLYSHWEAGHFDRLIYKYVWEENGKIMESLSDPNEHIEQSG